MSNEKPPTDNHRHYILEWAERRGLKQTDIVRELGADKAVVSRWFSGVIPSDKWLEPLSSLLQTEISGLFRHPDDDWISKMFRDRTEEQKESAAQMLRAFFEAIDREGARPGTKSEKAQ